MVRMLRLACGAALAASLIAPTPAQERREVAPARRDPILVAAARQRLAGPTARDLAWGAHLAVHDDLREVVPELRRGLERLRGDESDAGQIASAAILDALVVLEAVLPATELSAFLDGDGRAAAVLLLTRTQDAGPVLLDFMQRTVTFQDLAWVAAGNLLAADPPPGCAAFLLRSVRLELHIDVVDGPAFSSKGGYASVACGGPAFPVDFPEIGVWVLDAQARRGARLVAPGPVDVWARRRVVGGPFAWPCRRGRVGERIANATVAAWLRTMAGLDGAEPAPTRTVKVAWTGPTACLEAARRHAAEFTGTWTAVRDRLCARRLIADESIPDVRVELVDRRRDRSLPLPVWPGPADARPGRRAPMPAPVVRRRPLDRPAARALRGATSGHPGEAVAGQPGGGDPPDADRGRRPAGRLRVQPRGARHLPRGRRARAARRAPRRNGLRRRGVLPEVPRGAAARCRALRTAEGLHALRLLP